jgi:hypothetical protein
MKMYRNTLTAMIAALAIAGAGCATDVADAGQAPDGGPAAAAAAPASGQAPDHANRGRSDTAPAVRNVVDIVVTGHSFDMPESIRSGWTTFRLHNQSSEVHFGLLDLLPDGKTVDDSIAEIAPVFQDAMDLIRAGEPEAGFEEFANLPAWSAEIVYMGGPGLVAPGETAETTVYLEPGTYVIECYVLTDGVFHTTHGMIAGFTVTEEDSGATEPTADVTVTLSSDGETGEMVIDGEFRPGKQTVAVHFANQAVHGNVLGHDLHIARIDDDTDLDELETWMNWITGMEAPAPVHFLGGTHDMPAGSTAYVEVLLTPGTYVLISEVDAPASKGLLQTITVP